MVALGSAAALLVLLGAMWPRGEVDLPLLAGRGSSPLHPLALRSGSGWLVGPSPVAGEAELCRGPGATGWLPLKAAEHHSGISTLVVQVAAGGEETVGLAFRVQDAASYYLARINTRNNNLRLYRYVGGAPTLLTGRDLAIPVGQPHELTVTAEGARLAVALDGEPVLEVVDRVWASGGLALWAAPDTQVCFQLPATLAAQG